jgi:Protein kinase domain
MNESTSSEGPDDRAFVRFLAAPEGTADSEEVVRRFGAEYPSLAEEFRSMVATRKVVAMSAGAKGHEGPPAPPSAAGVDLPQQFGRFRIARKLGQGRTGSVYLAHDLRLDRAVALRIPQFKAGNAPEAVGRFYREVEAAAKFDNPNLCPVYDVGNVDGIHDLTMPYLEGRPLEECIEGARMLDARLVARLVRRLALALSDAHAQGAFHRGLNSKNIMVCRHRDLVVMDFGLAQLARDVDPPIVQPEETVGTLAYLAPEQVRGDSGAVGAGCDIYSLGVILYELLTGKGGRPGLEPEWKPARERVDGWGRYGAKTAAGQIATSYSHLPDLRKISQ